MACGWCGIQQHFPDILREAIPVPNSEMKDLVPAEKQTFQVESRQGMVDPGYPLWHPHVIGVFRFEQKFQQITVGCPG